MLMFAYPATSRHEDPVGSRNIFSSMDGGELQDDAAQVPRKYIGAILGVLREVGLVGPKLAFQVGDEQRLSEQLAERAKVAYGGWVLRLVQSHVKAACDSVELDVS